VAVQSTNPGTSLFYTLDGSLPATNSRLYAGPVTVSTLNGQPVSNIPLGQYPSTTDCVSQNNYLAEQCASHGPNWGKNSRGAGPPCGNRNAAKSSPEYAAFALKVRDLKRRARAAIAAVNALIAMQRSERRVVTIMRVTHIRDGVVVRDYEIRYSPRAPSEAQVPPTRQASTNPLCEGRRAAITLPVPSLRSRSDEGCRAVALPAKAGASFGELRLGKPRIPATHPGIDNVECSSDRRAMGRRGQRQDRRLAVGARRRGGALPGRAQCRPHAGDRRRHLQAQFVALRRGPPRQIGRDRQRRRGRSLGAGGRDREAARSRRDDHAGQFDRCGKRGAHSALAPRTRCSP